METALNLLWLALAISALVAWKLRWSRHLLPNSPFLTQNARLIALCCALVLLFFIISVSDDLQQATGLMEDSTSRGSAPFKTKFNRADVHNINQAATDAAWVLSRLLLCPRVCVGRIHLSGIFTRSSISRLSVQGRAPPITIQ